MKFRSKIKSLESALRIKLLNKRIPLAVRWQLTNRCPNKCLYCKIWAEDCRRELSTEQVLTLMDSLKNHGTQTISFSGGEPLLRDDIGTILEHCHRIGIASSMNSSGALVVQKIDQLKKLGLLKLSLDGPEEIHDMIANRKGLYRQVLDAVETAQGRGIKTIFTATLTKYNIACLPFILETARKYKTLVAFQPLKRLSRGLQDLEEIMPGEQAYKRAVAELVSLKKKGDGSMSNSLYELEHIYHWPRYKKLKCWAGRIFCMIGPQGELYSCDRIPQKGEPPNCIDLGFRKAFASVPVDVDCDGCGFCGTLELNFLLSLKLGIIKTINAIAG